MIDPAVVDLDRVVIGMDERGLESGPLIDVELLTGGTQNILIRFRRGRRSFVLRRPPPHKRSNSDETMRRESRALAALAGTDVPHPALIAAEPDEAVIGAAFYLMESIDGYNATLGLPPAFVGDRGGPARDRSVDGRRHRRARTDRSGRRRASPTSGRWDGWGERQVPRWRKQLDSYASVRGLPRTRHPRGRRGGGVARLEPADRSPAGAHPRRLPLRQRAHPPHRTAGGGNRRLGARDDRRSPARSRSPAGVLAEPRAGEATRSRSPTCRRSTRSSPGTQRAAIATCPTLTWFRVLACYRLGLILEGTQRPGVRRAGARGDRRPAPRAHAGPARTGHRPHRRVADGPIGACSRCDYAPSSPGDESDRGPS